MTDSVIYALVDPRTAERRYVGKTTVGLAKRLRQHMNPSHLRHRNHRSAWLKGLAAEGLTPVGEVLEINPTDLNSAEKAWIVRLRQEGCRLTNSTDGGSGALGIKQSVEWIAKRTQPRLGKALPPDVRQKISASLLGRKTGPKSEAIRQHMAVARGAKEFVDQTGTVYNSVRGAARVLGLHHSNIIEVLKTGRGTLKGYSFRYVE